MAHTRKRRRGPYRTLRREAPSTVAVLADPGDFAAMTSTYRSFTFNDHAAYLRQTEVLLRSLAGQGVHTRVACFDAADYARYCEEERLDPDTSASRARYAAELAAAGPTLPYGGETIGQLVPLLLGSREPDLTWEEVTALVACAGPEGDSGAAAQEYGRAAFSRAVEVLAALLEAVGPGIHHLVCSVSAPDAPMSAALRADRRADGGLHLRDPDPLLLCGVLATGLATGSAGGVVVRTESAEGEGEGEGEVVRGWRLRDGWLSPLSEAEVFAAYCTDAGTGEPVPPESGVRYAAGTALPPPGDGTG